MEPSIARKHWAVVLAGGDGTRLQELTRELTGMPIPKQYCRILGKRSMLETTLIRTQHYAPLEHTLVIINDNHLEIAQEQLHPLQALNVLVQPCNRDTGPGLLFALLMLARRDPTAIVAVFPSDHYVEDDRTFVDHVTHAVHVVAQMPEKIVLLGIHPDRPETEYGYIVPGGPLSSLSGNGSTFHVASFCEKPSLEIAQGLLRRGGLWNSFVMVFQIARMLELLRDTLPNEFEHMRALERDPGAIRAVYKDLRPWNFSHGFLARIPRHLAVLQVDDVQWSDWGSRDSIERTLRRLTHTVPWQTPLPAAAAGAS